MTSPFGSGNDIGWAGAYVPMVVSASTLEELRNLAGPPASPGEREILVNLFTGEFKWKPKFRSARRATTRRRRR